MDGPAGLQRLGGVGGGDAVRAPPELPVPLPAASCPNTGQADGLALGFKFKLKFVVEEEEPQPLLLVTGLSLLPSATTED